MVRCRSCNISFANRGELHRHRNRHHRQFGGAELQSYPWAEGEDVFANMINGENIRETYDENHQYILAPHYREGEINSYYNFPINQVVQDQDIEDQMQRIFQSQNSTYKVNVCAGVILQEKTSNVTRYFRPASNATLLTYPIHVWNQHSLTRAIRELIERDINELIRHYRPDSGYVVRFITQLEYYVYSTDYPLGQEVNLPPHIKNNKGILSRQKMRNGQFLQGNLCFFNAIAQSQCENMQERYQAAILYKVAALFRQWQIHCSTHLPERQVTSMDRYEGFQFCDIAEAEECFKVNINVLEIMPDRNAYSRFTTMKEHEHTVYMNIYQNHLSLITDMDMYAHRFICQNCDRVFRKRGNLIRHHTTCMSRVKHVFPGGYYKYHKDIFSQLEECGIQLPETDRYYNHFAVWDLEAILQPLQNNGGVRTHFTHRHKAISFSVCSNVEGFTNPYTVVNSDTQQLVNEMFNYLDQIRQKAVSECYLKWGPAYSELLHKIQQRKVHLTLQLESEGESGLLDEGRLSGDESEDDDVRNGKRFMKDPLYKSMFDLKEKLWLYIHQFVVISYNGAKYDEQLIKKYLATYFLANENKEEETITFQADYEEGDGIDTKPKLMGRTDMIKRGNAYVCIANRFYRMLDLCNYLPPATSYSAFLKAYDMEESKFIFPYEYLSSAEVLAQEQLPPYPSNAWYSTLKQVDLLQCDYDNWLEAGQKGDPPMNGQQKYDMIMAMWQSKGWKTMEDYLKYYNSCDTLPMVGAVQKLMDSYMTEGIDVWKDCLSTPGISRILLMKSAQKQNVLFPLIDEGDKDLFYMFKAQIVAGPSIVFTRDLHVDHSPLFPDSDQICKSILGYDCCSLYLAQMLHAMPSQSYVRRHREDGFYPKHKRRYIMMFIWLEYKARMEGVHIRTRQNQGYECRVGPYFVDGLSVDNGVITTYEYQGCYHHSHRGCYLNKRDNATEMAAINERDEKREKWFRENGYHQQFIWECDMLNLLVSNSELKEQYRAFTPKFYNAHRGRVTEQTILDAIKNDQIFGFFIVDIHTPSHLQAKFAKYPPLFANSHITLQDVGEHMRNFMVQNNINLKARKLLISAMAATDILLSSPLLKWYLEHGLVVTKIQQVIEFVDTYPFQDFVNDITHHRQMADKIPTRKIIAMNKKLTGNAAYGSLILDKQKYTKTRNISGLTNGKMAVNQPNFKSISVIGEHLYQVDTVPARIKMNLPTYLGLWILLYAKLRMLQFVMDYLEKYLNPEQWIIGQTDTDSLYIGLSECTLEGAVKAEYKELFLQMTKQHCGALRHPDNFIPRSCCKEHNWLDSRTPDLFKLEWSGHRLISLNSKTYAGVDKVGAIKLSSKGVNTSLVKRSNPIQKYSAVLETQTSSVGTNRGFRVDNEGVKTYTQTRLAFTYLYLKRIVHENGIHTQPLEVTLNPVPISYVCIQTDAKILGPDFKTSFIYRGRSFSTIRQALTFMLELNTTKSQDVLNHICQTTNPSELQLISSSNIKQCKRVQIRLAQLEQIVLERLEQIPNGREMLQNTNSQLIVNVGEVDSWMGVKYNARVLRWIANGHLMGQNSLGVVYMKIRGNLAR